MTTKHNARAAQANLYAAKQRAASAMTGAQKRAFEARQRALQEKTRAARKTRSLAIPPPAARAMVSGTDNPVFDLGRFPAHLGLGAGVSIQPEFTGDPAWYAAYGARNGSDGAEGRLVSVHSFSKPWDSWEMHPKGEELVVCLAGELTLHQEIDGRVRTVTLKPYEAIVNPRGVWHTADVSGEATALFITAGEGTELRGR